MTIPSAEQSPSNAPSNDPSKALSEPWMVSLPMYDLPEARVWTDELWAAVRDDLRAEGMSCPDELTRPDGALSDHWRSASLLLSHTCGYPLVRELTNSVDVVGSFSTIVDEPEHPGHYRSVIICRVNDHRGDEAGDGDQLGGFRPESRRPPGRRERAPLLIAANGPDSLSGWVSMGWAWQKGVSEPSFHPPVTSVLVTGSHVASVQAVQSNRADLASIDSWTYFLLHRYRPEALEGLRVIGRGPAVAVTPLITAAGGPIDALRRAVSGAIGRKHELRDALGITGFVEHGREVHVPVVELAADALRAFDSSLIIRAARLDDYPFLGPIDLASNQLFADHGHPEFETDESIPEEAARAATAEQRLFVGEVFGPDGSPVIVAWVLLIHLDGELCIGQISVHPDAAQRGYGSAMLRMVIRHGRATGERSIVLNTQTDIPWNRPWYEKHGFEVVPEAEWTPGMRRATTEQSADGLDWSTRVHMRLNLRTA